MITAVTRGARLGSFVSGFAKKESLRLSVCHYKSTCASCTGGYVVVNTGRSFTEIFRNTRGKLLVEQEDTNFWRRSYSTEEDLKSMNFEKISTETLESLSEYFDELVETASHLQDADVSSGDGVLTVKFGREYGTYVINRQVPNQQIWLSSPKSGPKRYDYINGTWIYKHDGKSLHQLLDEEIPDIVKCPVSFEKCLFSSKEK